VLPVIVRFPSLNCFAWGRVEDRVESAGGASGENVVSWAKLDRIIVAISAKAVAIVLQFIKYRDVKGISEHLLRTWNVPFGRPCN
jgi:hypothetical protein